MNSTCTSTHPLTNTPSLNRARRAAFGSFAGAVVEWYDFLLYGITAALVFNSKFFPSVSPAMGTLAAFATFGVGFLFRPLGGVIFGQFGANYRYSGAGVGYQVASVVGGGFTPFIAAALVTFSGGNWHTVAIYLLAGCLVSTVTALLMKEN
ncbi:TPA: hypothetical protein J1W36_003947 [Escherichia coli]|nr:hypothetical protein [Escherichia coli]HBA6895572.1 hypothetical protein [Escherichia coli]HBA6942718.1 hypothetical protein [Escherichia coli]HBA8153938.1 hypothetical protein [Escherichia coli]